MFILTEPLNSSDNGDDVHDHAEDKIVRVGKPVTLNREIFKPRP